MNRAVSLFVVGLTLSVILDRPAPALAQLSFSDVPPGHPAYAAVSQLARQELVFGYPDGTFGGRRAMARWEFAVALWRVVMRIDRELAKIRPSHTRAAPLIPTPPLGFFADVSPDSERRDMLEDLASLGIIRGYPDGTFAGRRPLTDHELAVTLQRTLQWVERELAQVESSRAKMPPGDASQR